MHAVVCAQLGAISHSMIEFGCGFERSAAFVRRMAIRNQLPISQRTILLQHLVGRTNNSDSDCCHDGIDTDANAKAKIQPKQGLPVAATEDGVNVGLTLHRNEEAAEQVNDSPVGATSVEQCAQKLEDLSVYTDS